MTFFCFCSPWGLFYSKELHTWLNSFNIRVNVVQIKPQFKHFMLFLVTSFFKNTNGRHPSIDVPKSSIVLYSTFGNILILGLFLAKVLGFLRFSKQDSTISSHNAHFVVFVHEAGPRSAAQLCLIQLPVSTVRSVFDSSLC